MSEQFTLIGDAEEGNASSQPSSPAKSLLAAPLADRMRPHSLEQFLVNVIYSGTPVRFAVQ